MWFFIFLGSILLVAVGLTILIWNAPAEDPYELIRRQRSMPARNECVIGAGGRQLLPLTQKTPTGNSHRVQDIEVDWYQ